MEQPSDERWDALIDGDDRPPSLGHRLVQAGGLVLIGVVFVALFLRLDDGRQIERDSVGNGEAEGGRGAAMVIPPGTAGGQEAAASSGWHSPAPPLMLVEGPAAPDREPVAGLAGAIERFGDAFTIRHPTYLPADVAPFTVNWQPDAQAERRAQGLGELYTWFHSAEHGAVLVLAQGPAVGVWPLTAGDDRAGRVRLADGTEAVWVIGHPTSVTGGTAGASIWEGTEITLGVPAASGDGWYLRSPIVSLEEMLRVANSLRPAVREE